jgi:inhibitor of cysteine peptidase
MTALVGIWFIFSPGAVSCPKSQNGKKMVHELVETDNERTADICLHETVRITLPENATTGYRWVVERYDGTFLNELATESHYPKTAVVGSGGNVVFIFQGKKSGRGEILLKQWRSWEGDASVIARFRVLVNVLP